VVFRITVLSATGIPVGQDNMGAALAQSDC
jgi:hypothetical protein